MTHFNPADFGPAWAELLETDRCRPLGAGKVNQELGMKLQNTDLERLFSPHKIDDREMADLCLAAAWLLADDLDASHRISQQYETPSGSFWHGIMHRREVDFDNAKYWFRRVGEHPVFSAIGEAARQLASAAAPSPMRDKVLNSAGWDPFLFVDLCAQCERSGAKNSAETQLCRQIAQAEWELLFQDCYRQAIK